MGSRGSWWVHAHGWRQACSAKRLVLGAAAGGRHDGRVLSNDEDVAVSNRFWERPGIRMGIRQLGGSERGVSRARGVQDNGTGRLCARPDGLADLELDGPLIRLCRVRHPPFRLS